MLPGTGELVIDNCQTTGTVCRQLQLCVQSAGYEMGVPSQRRRAQS